MSKILVALILGVAILLPAAAAVASDDAGPDHDTFTVKDLIQTEPVQLGTLSGVDKAPSMPYFDLRQENYGN